MHIQKYLPQVSLKEASLCGSRTSLAPSWSLDLCFVEVVIIYKKKYKTKLREQLAALINTREKVLNGTLTLEQPAVEGNWQHFA